MTFIVVHPLNPDSVMITARDYGGIAPRNLKLAKPAPVVITPKHAGVSLHRNPAAARGRTIGQEDKMIPLRLIHEHNESLVDAAYQGALLGIESARRISQYALASRRQQLGDSRLLDIEPAAHPMSPALIAFGMQTLAEYRHALEVAGSACEQWADLCHTQWRKAHDRAHSTMAYLADHGPAEAAPAMRLAQMGNDLALDSAERIAKGSKDAVVEAASEIASALPAKKPARRSAGKP